MGWVLRALAFSAMQRGHVKAPQIIEFLQHLMRHLRRPLLVIWDGLSGHRGCLVRDFVAAHRNRITLEFLPGYAPELTPGELWELSDAAKRALRRMRRRPALVTAFWKQDVCRDLGVTCINLLGLMRREGWVL
jgi:hypothetical protein